MNFKLVGEYAVSAQRLFQTLTSEAYIMKQGERMRASKTAVKIVEDSARLLRLEIQREELARGIDGKTTGEIEHTTEAQTWDKNKLCCEWSRHMHSKGDTVVIRGCKQIEPAGGENCRLCLDNEVEIKVPLIGKMLAKKIVAAVERHWPEELAWDRQFLAGAI